MSKSSSRAGNVAVQRLKAVKEHFDGPRLGRLANKVAIITGAGSPVGIGRSSALLYAREGAAALYLTDLQMDGLKSLQQEINHKYPDVKVTIIQSNAADEEAIESLCARILQECGRLDVFFANAAIGSSQHLFLEDITSKDMQRMLDINVVSCFLALKYGGAAMKVTSKDKPLSAGSIVMTASVAGTKSGAGPIDYSASKAAVISLAQTGANHYVGTNIRCNALCPGLIETGMTQVLFDRARDRGTTGKIGQLNPLGRYGMAEEMAHVSAFLASDDASYVNGAVILADGGLSSSLPVVRIGSVH